jgi:acyl-CoA reductase-like NAD-dependent aldehyde dehydrogenase
VKSYLPYINGRDQDQVDGKWVHVMRASAFLDDAFGTLSAKRSLDRGLSPVEEDPRVVGRVALATREQGMQALAAARSAQRQWARTPLKKRLAFWQAFNEVLRARADEFVEVLISEGHPRRLAQWEVAGAIEGTSSPTVELHAALIEQVGRIGQREVRLVRKPDGVVCISPPQNAAATTSLLGVPALAAGNSLVVKAPRSCPLGVAWVWREIVVPLLDEFGAPPGTLGVICGDPRVVIDQWIDSPHVDDVMFVGASARGIEIGKRCVAAGKKPILELAGNDGVLVWDDADLELAARALAECFYGSSQICMVPKYAIVHPRVADQVIDLLIGEIGGVHPGRPEDPATLLTPVLRTQEFFEVLAQARAAGTLLVAGGERIDQDGVPSASGVFLQPTVVRVDGLPAAGRLRAVREETFYPLLPVVVPQPAQSRAMFQDCLEFMESNPYGLRNSLWSNDPEIIAQFCDHLSNGGVLKINDSHIGFVSTLPTHGGTGLSGGPFGECNFPLLRTTHLQGISIATSVMPRRAVFDSAALPAAEGASW